MLTRISLPPFSLLVAIVNPMIPCLLASYAAWFAKPAARRSIARGLEEGSLPVMPWMDATLTIDPITALPELGFQAVHAAR